jgi:lambda family phage tail tape measure protein
MAEIGHLRAALSANSAAFEADMKKARNAVRSNAKGMERAMESVGKKFDDGIKKLNKYGGTAAAAAAAGFVALIKSQINAADAIGKLGAQTGTTSEYLSSMQFVAEQSGITLETVGKAAQRMAKNMDDARRGVIEAKEAFAVMDIAYQDGNGTLRDTEEVINEIADKFSKLENGAEKTALAVKVFGKSGAELINMLNLGSTGIEGLQKKAEEMGLVISTETAMQAAFFNDQIHELQNTGVGFGRTLAMDMIPGLIDATAAIKLAYKEAGFGTAAFIALGAAASAIVTKSTTAKINEIDSQINGLKDTTLGFYKEVSEVSPLLTKIGFHTDPEGEIERLLGERKKLADQLAEEEASLKKRQEDALKRQAEEAESRREATEKLRASFEERMRMQAEEKKAEMEKDAANRKILQTEEQRKQSISDTIEGLEKELSVLGMTKAQLVDYELALLKATPAQRAFAASLAEEAEEKQRALDLNEKYKTSLDQIGDAIATYKKLLDAGLISQEIYNDAVSDAWDGMKDKGVDTMTDLQKAIEGWGRQSSKALADFVSDGKGSFSDFARSVINDMLQMLTYQLILGPIFSGISSVAGGGTFSAGVSAAGGIFGGANKGASGIMPGEWDWLGGLFGAGKAIGGPVSSGMIYPVNERGPELLNLGSQQFLMMGNQGGSVTPNNQIGNSASGETNIRVINVTDPSMVADFMSSPDGDRVFINMLSRHGIQPG